MSANLTRKTRTVRTAAAPRVAPRAGFAKDCGHLVAIDSAKDKPAVADFGHGRLYSLSGEIDPDDTPCGVVLETPRAYPNDPRPNDILAMAVGGALVAGSFRAPVTLVYPDEWIGQCKKPPHHLAIWEALTPQEICVLRDEWRRLEGEGSLFDYLGLACNRLAMTGKVTRYSHPIHNVLDAVGLGLFALGRIGKAGGKGPYPL